MITPDQNQTTPPPPDPLDAFRQRLDDLDRRIEDLRKLERMANRAQNRTTATIEGIRDLVSSYIAQRTGRSAEQIQEAIDCHAARHLVEMLHSLNTKDHATAAVVGATPNLPPSIGEITAN
jgi:DNA-directed RNA polymerase specialized sigma subunit